MNGNIINPDAPVDSQNRDNSKKIHLDFFQEDINTNSTTVCSNCGKVGHLFYQCKLPITSYGVILFRFTNEPEFLMICRKKTLLVTLIL